MEYDVLLKTRLCIRIEHVSTQIAECVAIDDLIWTNQFSDRVFDAGDEYALASRRIAVTQSQEVAPKCFACDLQSNCPESIEVVCKCDLMLAMTGNRRCASLRDLDKLLAFCQLSIGVAVIHATCEFVNALLVGDNASARKDLRFQPLPNAVV